MRPSRLVNRNVMAPRGRTSMRLEPELWDALLEICRREHLTLAAVIQRVDGPTHPSGSDPEGGRTSAVRVFTLGYFRAAATTDGHAAAGHGELDEPAGSPQSRWPCDVRCGKPSRIVADQPEHHPWPQRAEHSLP